MNEKHELYIDYVFLSTDERKKLYEVWVPSHIDRNKCYRTYKNFDILFTEEKVGKPDLTVRNNKSHST